MIDFIPTYVGTVKTHSHLFFYASMIIINNHCITANFKMKVLLYLDMFNVFQEILVWEGLSLHPSV